jgi:hypothetical protein
MNAPVVIGHKPSIAATTSPGVPHVYEAICGVTAALAKEGVGKDRKNPQQGYQFRGVEDVQNALAPVLAANHLCMLPSILERSCTERTTQKGGTLFYVVLRVRFDLVSAIDGSSHSVITEGEAMDSGDKATNKAMSAAFKYASVLSFCIPTEGAEDADAHTPEPSKPVPPAARAAALHEKAVAPPAPAGEDKHRDRVDRVVKTLALLDTGKPDAHARIQKAKDLTADLEEELFLHSRDDLKKILDDAFKAAFGRVQPTPDEEPPY